MCREEQACKKPLALMRLISLLPAGSSAVNSTSSSNAVPSGMEEAASLQNASGSKPSATWTPTTPDRFQVQPSSGPLEAPSSIAPKSAASVASSELSIAPSAGPMSGAVSPLIRSGSTGSTADPNQSSETSKASQPNSNETSTPGPEGDDRIQDPGSETKTPTGDDESKPLQIPSMGEAMRCCLPGPVAIQYQHRLDGLGSRLIKPGCGCEGAGGLGPDGEPAEPDLMTKLAKLALEQLEPAVEGAGRKDSVSVVKMTGGLATLFQERDLGAEAQLLPLDPLGVRKPAVKSEDPRAVLEALRIPPGKLVHLSTDEYTGI